jgi:multiple sugar transport system permease protein
MKRVTTPSDRRWFWLLVSPTLVGFIALVLGPMLASLWLSFTKFNVVEPPVFVGLRNYLYLFQDDPTFWPSLRVTLIYAALFVPSQIVVALTVALALNQNVPGRGAFRTIYFLPSILPAASSGIIWLWMFSPRGGLLNTLLAKVGIEGPAWVYSSTWALPTLVVITLWPFGASMLVFLAALQSIPRHLYEAASIDGANAAQRFRAVTLPGIAPAISFNVIMGLIGALKVFDQAFIVGMGGPGVGGPGRSTLFMVLNIYQQGFGYFHMGLASAMAWVLFLIILCLTLISFLVRRAYSAEEVT